MKYLTIDGDLSGTGIRNSINGDFININELELSCLLRKKIQDWLESYEREHYFQFQDKEKINTLDLEGIKISKLIRKEIPDSKIEYFSAAKMKTLFVE